MKAEVIVIRTASTPVVRLEHKGEAIEFSVSVFGRNCFQLGYDVFHYPNVYWASLPEETQEYIFTIYKDIHYGFETIWNKNNIFEFISSKVTELLEVHNLQVLQDWIVFKSDIHIPEDFKYEYIHDIDNNTSRAKTYIRSDYIELVTLSFCLRFMIPVWGEYISNIRQDTGSRFKEFFAFQLIKHSKLNSSTAITKLKLYIENIVGNDKYDPNTTLNSISSEDFSYWLLALVCIRRLCVGDIRGTESESHLIKVIYKFIMQKINNNENNYESMVKFKSFDDKGTNTEHKISSLEAYRIKTKISLGDTTELEYSLKDIREVSSRLTSRLDPNILERSLQTSAKLMNEKILDPQIILLRWVFKPVISPRGIMYLPKQKIIEALGALEAVLWARGHKYLAILASSHAVFSNSQMHISPVDSKMRVPKELADELDKLYPFKKASSTKKTVVREVNPAANSINLLVDQLATYSWKSTASDDMIMEVFGTNTKKFPIKLDIKTDLTKLVIELGNRKYS